MVVGKSAFHFVSSVKLFTQHFQQLDSVFSTLSYSASSASSLFISAFATVCWGCQDLILFRPLQAFLMEVTYQPGAGCFKSSVSHLYSFSLATDDNTRSWSANFVKLFCVISCEAQNTSNRWREVSCSNLQFLHDMHACHIPAEYQELILLLGVVYDDGAVTCVPAREIIHYFSVCPLCA